MPVENPSILTSLIADPGRFVDHPDPEVRRLAVAGLEPRASGSALAAALATDDSSGVRAAAAEALGGGGREALDLLTAATYDPDPDVAEAATTALGSLGNPGAVDRLLDIARHGADKLVREAAVASLGALGDERAVPVLLDLVATGPPQVRRRCVAALTVFDDPAIEAALLTARDDRNPMVREAAEMVVGRELPDLACSPLLNLKLPD